MGRLRLVLIAGLIVGTTLTIVGGGSSNEQRAPATKTKAQEPVVTAVAGPSWLNRLGLRYGDTSLGRSGATYGPPPTQRPSPPTAAPLAVGRPVELSGADLYRLNCQSCHRAEGTGSPPEINPFLGSSRDRRSNWYDSTCSRRARRPLDQRRARRPLERGTTSISEFTRAGNGCRRLRTCRRPTSTPSTPT